MKILFILFVSAAMAMSFEAAAQAIQPGDITEIILETGDGFCFDCERMTTLRDDGTAIYHGGKKSRFRSGDFSGIIGKAEFARLAKKILEAGFFGLKPLYEGTTSDVAAVKITVVYTNGRKTVENFKRSGEPELKLVEQAFNAAADEIEWRKQKLVLVECPPDEN